MDFSFPTLPMPNMLVLMISVVGGAVGLVVGIIIYSMVVGNVECPDPLEERQAHTTCKNAMNFGYAFLGIMPVGLFLALFFFLRNIV